MKILSALTFSAFVLSFFLPQKVELKKSNYEKEFEKFIEFFPEKDLPFSISTSDFDSATARKDLVIETRTFENKFLSDIRSSHSLRVGRIVVEPIQYFKTNNNFIVFIYSKHHLRFSRINPPIFQETLKNQHPTKFSKVYKCSVFTEKGEQVSVFTLGNNNCRETKICSIDKSGIIEQIAFENKCQRTGSIYGLQGFQTIAGRKKKKTTSFKINKKGIFGELKESSTTARASL